MTATGPNGLLHVPGHDHFLNPAMLAANVMEIDFPAAPVARLQAMVPEIQTLEQPRSVVTLANGLEFHIDSPPTWRSDIRWISPNDETTFAYFEQIFQELDLAKYVQRYVRHDRELMLYASFFLTRSRCDEVDMHVDWSTGRNDAFTLLAPLTPNCEELGLAYMSAREEKLSYTYKVGKALLFGDHFYHSTAVGRTDERTVFLAMNFGTDRMENWSRLAATTGNQGDLHRRPDGKFVRRSEMSREEREALAAGSYAA